MAIDLAAMAKSILTAGTRKDRYAVGVYDCAGEFSQTSATDFAHCLFIVEMMARTYPDKVVRVFNLDEIDLGKESGLTEDEQNAVDEAHGRGRAALKDSIARGGGK
jgi:hypothetical protein